MLQRPYSQIAKAELPHVKLAVNGNAPHLPERIFTNRLLNMEDTGCVFFLQLIASHVGIFGKEIADALASSVHHQEIT